MSCLRGVLTCVVLWLCCSCCLLCWYFVVVYSGVYVLLFLFLSYIILYCCIRNFDFGFLLGLFFFFKQKTAYEMRISDWSSDVCSSDLHELRTTRGRLAALGDDPAVLLLELHAVDEVGREQVRVARLEHRDPAQHLPHDDLDVLVVDGHALAPEIGREPLRARVCQYV